MQFWKMRSRWLRVLLTFLAIGAVLEGCSSVPPIAASGDAAYRLIPPPGEGGGVQDYTIGSLDVLSITVFQEKDLSFAEVPVDASGSISFPLIGQVAVAGLTSRQVSKEIESRLGARYLVNPQVTVIVKSSVSQRVTVDGQVGEPGVYPLQGETTLIQAMAMAKGTTNIAQTDEVIVFRTVAGTRYAARFDIEEIRKGRAADPQLRANDIVVVGLSRAKSVFRDILTISPALTSAFIAITQVTQ